MRNHEARRAELKARHEQAMIDLDREEIILRTLPDDLAALESIVTMHKLYDRAGSLKFKYNRYTSIQRAPNPTLETARQLANTFAPAVPLVVSRESTVGIRTVGNAEAMPEEKRDNAQITRIAPFWVVVDPASHGSTVSLEWIATIEGMLIACEVEYVLHDPALRPLGDLSIRRSGAKGYGQKVERNDFEVGRTVRVLGNCAARQIRYASGSADEPGQHVIYWEIGSTDDATVDVRDLIAALQGKG